MSINPPFFSIIIPTLNEANTIGHLLEDLSQQSYQNFQVEIIDAQSQDNTIKVARSFKQKLPQLTITTNLQQNVCAQRNLGASHAQGQWLIFSDADTRIKPFVLQGYRYHIDRDNPQILTTYITPDSTDPKDVMISSLINLYVDIQRFTNRPYVLESFLAINKTVFTTLKGFNEAINFGEGNDLLRRAKKIDITLTLKKDPTYTYSLRRLRKEGTLKMARNVAQIELSRLLNLDIDQKVAQKLYPMKGGSFFIQQGQSRYQPVEKVLKLLSKVKQLPENFQANLKESLKEYL